LSESINVLRGKQPSMNPSSIHLIKHYTKDTNQHLYTNSNIEIQQSQETNVPFLGCNETGRLGCVNGLAMLHALSHHPPPQTRAPPLEQERTWW
jgi:hypothetical protein